MRREQMKAGWSDAQGFTILQLPVELLRRVVKKAKPIKEQAHYWEDNRGLAGCTKAKVQARNATSAKRVNPIAE